MLARAPAAAAARAARAPSKAALARRYRAITDDVNAAGTTFLERASSIVSERGSGRRIYTVAAAPFARALRTADGELLALRVRGKARTDVVALVRVGRKTIADLKKVSTSDRAHVTRWQQSISNDANAMEAAASRLRAAL